MLDQMDDVFQPQQFGRIVETQPWHASQLRLDWIAAVAQLLSDLVHHFTAACRKLIENMKLVILWVGEHAVDHALIDA